MEIPPTHSYGKIAVLKTLVASQLVYVLSPFPSNAGVIKDVNRVFYAFLWNGKEDKIKRDVVINGYPKGEPQDNKEIKIKSLSAYP